MRESGLHDTLCQIESVRLSLAAVRREGVPKAKGPRGDGTCLGHVAASRANSALLSNLRIINVIIIITVVLISIIIIGTTINIVIIT